MLSRKDLDSIVRTLGLHLLLHTFHDTLGVPKHRDVRDALMHVSCLAMSIVATSHLVDPIVERLGDGGRMVIFALLVLYVILRVVTARQVVVPVQVGVGT